MWIVRVALARPYTFIVLALLILILAPVVILRTPTDIFPNIDIPVIAAAFNYTGLSAQEMEERITSIYERSLTTTVNDIEHIESQSINGRAIIKVFFQPGADINAAVAQVSAISQPILRQLPPGRRAALSPHLQRLERAHPAARPLRARTQRTVAVRLRRQLHPHAAGDHSGLRDSLPVWRQAAPDHGRYQPRGHAVQGALAGRRHQGHRQPEPDHSGGHLEDRPVRIRCGSEFQPRNGGGIQRFPGQGGERLADLHPRYRPRARRLLAADQHRSPGWTPRACCSR